MPRLTTRSSRCVAMVMLMLAGSSAAADTEIHRCLLDDGTIAFQETPCPEPVVQADDESDATAADDDAVDFPNPFDEPPISLMSAESALPESLSQSRAECEKTTRDAIDVIDLEMRGTAYTKEQGEKYLAELLELTQQLRTCKQL